MGKRKRKAPAPVAKAPQPEERLVPRMLAGRPTIKGIVALVLIALVIGVSGGYLAYRFTGGGGSGAGQPASDPTALWRARLLQDPQDVEALLGLAHAHLDQNQLDQAESLYKQVLALQPKNLEATEHLGTIMLGRGQTDAALRQYDAALALQPDYIHALWDKANVLQQVKKDYAGAIKSWEAFITLVGPDSPDGKTAGKFLAEAKQALGAAPAPAKKAAGGKP